MTAKISVITATFNAQRPLPGLIDTLAAQRGTDFEWIVIDGASTDGTLDILKGAGALVTRLISEPDFGIYHALNKGLRIATGEYYLVLGADDRLQSDALSNYAKAAEQSGADVVTARITCDGQVRWKRQGPPWLYGAFSYVSGHAVGTLFRRNLHERFGYYSRRFPLAADQLFIKNIFKGGASCYEAEFIAGEFGGDGASSVDVAGLLSEQFRIQLETQAKLPQVLMYMMRLCKNYRRL